MTARELAERVSHFGSGVEVAVKVNGGTFDLHDIEGVELIAHPLYPKKRVIVLRAYPEGQSGD